MYFLGVVNLEGQPTDAGKRNRQCARERYVQMDQQKKDELLKKRREAYRKKKGQTSFNSEEAQLGTTRLMPSQLQNKQIVEGALHDQ